MKIKASWDIKKDSLGREFYYYVPFHNDIHLCYKNPYFILFIHEVISPCIFIHTVNEKLKYEELKEKEFYIFDASKNHGLFPIDIDLQKELKIENITEIKSKEKSKIEIENIAEIKSKIKKESEIKKYKVKETQTISDKSSIKDSLKLKAFDDYLSKLYEDYQEVEPVLIANVFDWQKENSFEVLVEYLNKT